MIHDLDSYDYSYPDELVALNPLAAKDQANMLVFKKNSFSHQRVGDLLKYVSPSDLLVFNNTRVMPARLTKKNYNEVLRISGLAHNALGCRGVTRSDFKFYKNKFYLLELNTQPGMTNLSLVPEIANYCGINFSNLVEQILLDLSLIHI